ncbi:MAG: LysM peptidoglycan-binding domain-containing protein [Candidatus Helarchaeota archaeon]|nr:LysM peptidoglycan-binding domain-containing protein [Candidatus Helarchaeota archaeon]
MNYAYKIVHSPYLKDKFRSDLEILQEFCDLYKSQTQEKRRSSLWSIIKWGFWIFVSIVILRPCFKDLSEETKKDTFKYTVQSGDTLSKIAKQYNVSIHDIATANKLYNINQLRVGQELTIPQTQTSTITERKVHLEEQIKDRKNKIKGWESYLTLLRTEAENLKNEIDDLNSEYSNSYYVPQYIIDDYNEKVEKYNAIVKKYESNYVVYKKEFDEYNEMVRQYNNMLK